MAKDAYYFSHDSNAKDDPKCVMLIEQLGLEGYGIYWVLIEMLRDQPEYKYPLALIPAIARRYNTTSEKMKTVIGNYRLFIVDENDFFSPALIKRMEYYEYKRELSRLAGKKSAQKRIANASSTAVQPTFNDCSTSIVDVSTVEKSIENESIEPLASNKFADDAIELFLASELYKLILGNNQNFKKPNLQSWAGHIDKMIRLDHRQPDEILKVIEWSQKDNFWQGNILSTKKLREKYDQLTMKMKSVHRVDKPFTNKRSIQEDVTAQWLAMHEEAERNGQV